MHFFKMKRILITFFAALAALAVYAQVPEIPGQGHALLKVDAAQKYLLLPVQESVNNASVSVITGGSVLQSLNVKLAVDKVDYFVPLDIGRFGARELVMDIVFRGDRIARDDIKDYVCWKEISQSGKFDTANRERFRPVYHHTPEYGWMNDPNGMFYKDGQFHVYYQWNPYGSQWENMTWGHSVSKDLIHWKAMPAAIEPDALGTIFSGSAVVDNANTAGHGRGAVVAFYTSAGRNQTQSSAFSTDNGKTFTKLASNPVITGDINDFRDPKAFWNEDAGMWNLILAAGQEMRIYSSRNLKDWKYESSFGEGYGCHLSVWECPDLMKLNVRGTDRQMWLLVCNTGGLPAGGSGTQYFIGEFDGHKFTTDQKETLWMDYGKDHYATVTFDNCPDGRKIALAWMSNWQYAGVVPTMQFRSANSVPRDLDIYEYDGSLFCGVTPSKELLALRGNKVKQPAEACEIVVNLKGAASIVLSNPRGEKVIMEYNPKDKSFLMDRNLSGDTSFHKDFPARTIAPLHGEIKQLRIFVDRCSVEVFDSEGKMAMSNLVFPSEPYDNLKVKGGKATVYSISY
jgi:levanase/fructan beta-fructosidase